MVNDDFAQSLPVTLGPGERLRLRSRELPLAGGVHEPGGTMVARWFDAEGRELLWSFPLS